MAAETIGPRMARVSTPRALVDRVDATSRPASDAVPIVALVLGAILTALSFRGSWVHLAYRLPRMHAVIDTTIGLICFLLAYLVYGRVQVLWRERDALLVFALGFSGVVSLFTAVTQSISSRPLGRFAVWTPTFGRLLVACLFAASAMASAEPIRHRVRIEWFTIAVIGGFLALMGFVAFQASHLPWSTDLSVAPTDATKPLFVGPTLMVLTQGLVLVAYSIAAWGFSHRQDGSDDLMTWLAASCTLFGLASLDYFAFPSMFSDWIYVGDILRLGGVVLLFVGAAREISGYWRARAAMDERRRLARDLHDGVAQELAYIASVARQLERDIGNRRSRRLADAAQHALDESRLVISTLAGAGDAGEQLATTARDAAHRYDLHLILDLESSLVVPGAVLEALLRIVREAINNAGRHASTSTVLVRLTSDDGIRLVVADDGNGFDTSRETGGFGLVSMRERAEALGGVFSITSAQGRGTTVEVFIP